MKITLDNIIFSLQRVGGVSIYWSELLTRFLRDQILVNVIEAKNANENFCRDKINIPIDQIWRDTRPISIARYLPALIKNKKIELFHSSYYRKSSLDFVPSIQTCYDFTYERFRKGPSRWIHSIQKKQAITAASGIICISENTRKDLLYYYPNIKKENTCVIHLGYSSDFRYLSKKKAMRLIYPYIKFDNPFSLFVGERKGYKNFFLTVDAISLYRNHRLVFVGGGSLSKYENEYLNCKLKNRWVHIEYAPNSLLNAIYNCAHAFIYPSSYEGFGIPIIEAMITGCPVIALNVSSVPEVAANGGILIDNVNAFIIYQKLKQLESSTLRKDIFERAILNAKRFSWERCYKQTLSFYSKILNN